MEALQPRGRAAESPRTAVRCHGRGARRGAATVCVRAASLRPDAADTARKAKGHRMVEIKTPEQIAKMREAGLVVAAMHEACRRPRCPGATTKDLDEVAAQGARRSRRQAEFPGLRRLPRNICTSVNDIVVHGIPDRETVLKDGDLLSIDAGAIIDGWHGDAALTVFVGEGHAPELHRAEPGDRGVHVGGDRRDAQGQPAGGRLPGDRGLHPPAAASGLRLVRHRRGLRRARHRLRRCTWTRTC